MKNNITLLKKKQRDQSSKKRLILNKNINLNNSLFFNILNEYIWFKKSKIIASFSSIKSEFPTQQINSFILNSGKILCLPSIQENSNDILIFKQYSQGDELIIGRFGVKEPLKNNISLPDIIFTPCLAYDTHGFRLGYGGGYYDKTISYLRSVKHKFLTIGLAYDDQKVDYVIHDDLDQKLNYILTEKRLYKIL